MENHEALRKCIGKHTQEIAKALHLAPITIWKWMEPHVDFYDSGSYNPVDRLEMIMQKAIDLGVPRDEALTPLYHLNQRFNLDAAALATCDDKGDLSLELAEALKEVGHLTTVASDALLSGDISRRHAERIEEEGNHLIRRVQAFVRKTRAFTHKRLTLKLFTRHRHAEPFADIDAGARR